MIKGHHADDFFLQGITVEEDIKLGVVDLASYAHENLLEGGLLVVHGFDFLDFSFLLLDQFGNWLSNVEVLQQHFDEAVVQ